MATVADCASHLFLTERSFYELLGAGKVDRQPTNGYDLDIVREQYIESLRETAAGRSAASGNLDLPAERARLAKEQADGQEMKNAVTRGELLPRSEVTAAVTSAFARVRARLLAVPTKTAPLLLGVSDLADLTGKLSDGIHEALAELSGTIVVAVSDADDEEGSDGGVSGLVEGAGASAEADGFAVGGHRAPS